MLLWFLTCFVGYFTNYLLTLRTIASNNHVAWTLFIRRHSDGCKTVGFRHYRNCLSFVVSDRGTRMLLTWIHHQNWRSRKTSGKRIVIMFPVTAIKYSLHRMSFPGRGQSTISLVISIKRGTKEEVFLAMKEWSNCILPLSDDPTLHLGATTTCLCQTSRRLHIWHYWWPIRQTL